MEYFKRNLAKDHSLQIAGNIQPPKMDGHETTTSHVTAQPTCWKRIKKNWQVAITALWMSFVTADSFVSLTDALVRKTLKYWWWWLWWIWMVDDWEMLLSSLSYARFRSGGKRKERWGQTSVDEFHNQQSLKRHLLTRSVLNDCGYFPPRVINGSAKWARSWMTSASFDFSPKPG